MSEAINRAVFDIIKTIKDPALNGNGQVGPRQYKYVTLEFLLKTVKPYFYARDLVICQSITSAVNGGVCAVGVKTVIKHKNGDELIVGEMLAPCGSVNDAQKAGAWITYARRYSLMSFLGLVGDEDADGGEPDVARAYDDVMNEMPYCETTKTGFKEKTREWIKANLGHDETFSIGEAYFEIVKIGYLKGVSLVDEKVVGAVKNSDLACLRKVIKDNS